MFYLARVAIHEAGHAIAGLVHGCSVENIYARLNNTGGRMGAVRFTQNTAYRNLKDWQIISIYIAGSVAELGYDGKYMKDLSLNAVNGSLDDDLTDKAMVSRIIQAQPVSQQESILKDTIQFTGSRLMRNWHHVNDLAKQVKENGELDFIAFQQWYDKRMRYEKFYY